MHAIGIEFIKRHFSASVIGQAQAFYSAISFGLGGALGALLSGQLWQAGAAVLFDSAAFAVILYSVIFISALKFKT